MMRMGMKATKAKKPEKMEPKRVRILRSLSFWISEGFRRV